MTGAQRIYLWFVDGVDPSELRDALSDQERQRADQISHPNKKKEFVCGRALCRDVFQRELHLPLPSVIPTNAHGKPLLSSTFFNISHSSGYVGLAVDTENEVGFDMEKDNGKREVGPLIARYASSKELLALRDLAKTDQNKALYKLWCLKESYGKALGHGLRESLKNVEFDLGAGKVKIPSDHRRCYFHYIRRQGLHLSFCSMGKIEEAGPQIYEVEKTKSNFRYRSIPPSHFEESIRFIPVS